MKAHVVQAFKIPSEAMRPTLVKGDRVWVDERIYKRAKPQRGDIIVFRGPDESARLFIRRLVGLPGENLEIKDTRLLINGAAIREPPSIAALSYLNRGSYGQEGKSVVIPADRYYVLADNSAQSRDSRYLGFVQEKDLIGKAYKIYYPFDRSGPLE